MTTDELDRLRAANPLPGGSRAPNIESILARIDIAKPTDTVPRRRPSLGFLVPILGTAVVLTVLVVVLAGASGGDHRRSREGLTPTPYTPGASKPLAPRSGMRGVVQFQGTVAGSGVVISIQQCLGCQSNGNATAGAQFFNWLLTTTGSGPGRLVRSPYKLDQPTMSGADGWVSGLKLAKDGRGGTAEFYVTHDDGRHWSIAPTPEPDSGDQELSVGFGEVWSVGIGTKMAVVHAPVSSSRLVATLAQPVAGEWPNVQVAAAGRGMAYVYNGSATGQMLVTRDDGRSWQNVGRACPSGAVGSLIDKAFGDALWVLCQRAPKLPNPLPRHYRTPQPRVTLARSTDGGAHWTRLSTPFGGAFYPRITPVSPLVLWAETARGIVRSTDGGATWRLVWSLARSQVKGLRSESVPGTYWADLTAESRQDATIELPLLHGRSGSAASYTNVITYRTSDGGMTWIPQVIPLAAR